MKIITAEQMRRVDRETIGNHGITGPELMENAGRGIAERIISTALPVPQGKKVAVFCGKGNNGGDGFVVGRYLHKAGAVVAVYHMGPAEMLSDDARLNYDRAVKLGMDLYEISYIEDLPEELPCDLVVDALFGTGFSGAPRGLSGELIEYINDLEARVVAVDMPSGLSADDGQFEGAVVQADYSFTLALPKFGLYVSPGRELAGAVETVPIGVPEEVVDAFDFKVDLITGEMVADMIPERIADGHKGDFGKLLLVAGSTGLTGAAALAAKSALRCGCGLAKIGCPASVLPIIATLVMEATSHPLPDVAKKGALALRALGAVRQLMAEHDAVAIGPGLGQHRETAELVRRLITDLDRPAVIDADGLNAIAANVELLKEITLPIVLTPHPGEFRRMTGDGRVPTEIHARISAAVSFATEYGVVLVLKGSPTLVACPDGSCYLNPTGNDGMATGGSGDVLTGVIGAFLAQGVSAEEAAVSAVYIHGLAGDFAADQFTGRGMVAGDMLNFLPDVFESLDI